MEQAGAAYLIASSSLDAADAADGIADGFILLMNVASRFNSWKFMGEAPDDRAGSSLAPAGDVDGDRIPDFLIGAPGDSGPDDAGDEVVAPGTVYLVSGASLSPADRADGQQDGIIELRNLSAQPGSWKLVGEQNFSRTGSSLAMAGDTNGDGLAELFIGAPGYDGDFGDNIGAAYLVSPTDLASMDAADGNRDGIVNLANAAAQPSSWKLTGSDVEDSEDYRVGHSIASAGDVDGDVDGDGLTDVLIGAENAGDWSGAAYVLSALDLADGYADGYIELGSIVRQRSQ